MTGVFEMEVEAWIGIGVAIVMFWGIASWALVRTLRQEDRKVELVGRQKRLDTYSPAALDDLREFIENNPEDPYVEDAREKHNRCVENLREIEEYYYDWTDAEVDSLESL